MKKRASLIFRSKSMLWKILLVIIFYSAISFHGIFRKEISYRGQQPMVDSHEIIFQRKNIMSNSSNMRVKQKSNGINIHRARGGVHSIYDPPRKDIEKDLGQTKKRSWGLAYIDLALYQESSKYVINHDPVRKPRVVMLYDDQSTSFHSTNTIVEVDVTPFSDNTQLYGLLSSDDEALSKMEVLLSDEDGECVSETWHSQYHPSCNSVHEFDFLHVDDRYSGAHLTLFEKQGYWRNAWRADVPLSSNEYEMESFIIKTPK
jgi:hypothetical protein